MGIHIVVKSPFEYLFSSPKLSFCTVTTKASFFLHDSWIGIRMLSPDLVLQLVSPDTRNYTQILQVKHVYEVGLCDCFLPSPTAGHILLFCFSDFIHEILWFCQ